MYKDEFNITHHVRNPSPTASENGPFYSGLRAILDYADGEFSVSDAVDSLTILRGIYRNHTWYTTPVTLNNDRFSLDNFTGVVCLLTAMEKTLVSEESLKEVAEYKKALPWFHKQLDHPKDFAFVWWYKKPWLFWWLLPITWIAMIVSCAQGHKTRGGVKIAKTDGKLLALARSYAGGKWWRPVQKVCTWLVRNKWHDHPIPRNNHKHVTYEADRWKWDSWYNVSLDYFPDIYHPINHRIEMLEGGTL